MTKANANAFPCPACGASLSAARHHSGVRCEFCGTWVAMDRAQGADVGGGGLPAYIPAPSKPFPWTVVLVIAFAVLLFGGLVAFAVGQRQPSTPAEAPASVEQAP